MLICVGATSGYCATGSAQIAAITPNMIMIARTQAKIGRSMKIRDMVSASAAASAAGLHRSGRRRLDSLRRARRHWLDRRSVLQVGETLGDDLLAWRQALGDNPVGPEGAIGDYRPLDRAVRWADHKQYGIALRAPTDGLLRHQDRGGLDRLRELGSDEHARQEDRLRVGEARADRHRARALIDDDLAELNRAREAVDRP